MKNENISTQKNRFRGGRLSRFLALLLCLLLCATGFAAAPKQENSVLSGWIRVASEDAQGNVLTVEIVVGEEPHEEPYLVRDGETANQLKQLLGEWVVASGVVYEDELGWKSIQVVRFTKVDDLPEPVPMPETTPAP